MNDMIYPSAFVATALVGWGMYVRGSHRTGNALLALSLVGLWCLAVLHHEHRHTQIAPNAVRRAPIAELRTPDAVTSTPIAARPKPYFASIRLDSHTYHKSDCTKYSATAKYVKWFDTPEEAEAEGKKPCSFCLPSQIARVQQ